MSSTSGDKIQKITPEVIIIPDDESLAQHVMEQSRLDEAMKLFAYQEPLGEEKRPISEGELGKFLREFTDKIVLLSSSSGHIDSDAIRDAFGVIAAEMNKITNEKLGTARRQRSRLIEKFLQLSADIPYERRVVTGFTEEEWDKQFKPKIDALSTKPSEREVTNATVYDIFHGFALAPFSYVPQANRWA